MKTEIDEQEDSIVISMQGRLDYETCIPLRENLSKIKTKSNASQSPKKIIFNFKNLDFVGSSAIASFIQTLKEFNLSLSHRPVYHNVKSEFRKMIRVFDTDDLFDFYDTTEDSKPNRINQ